MTDRALVDKLRALPEEERPAMFRHDTLALLEVVLGYMHLFNMELAKEDPDLQEMRLWPDIALESGRELTDLIRAYTKLAEEDRQNKS